MMQKQLNYHLMPRKGWLNDPNGLVYFKGTYHIFYQADENSMDGSVNKSWGHYSTKDFQTYTRHALAICADSKYDRDGAYSGSAVIKDDILYVFYTGNVKYEGDYDYIHEGREHNVMRMESHDGITFENKKCLLRNTDFPQDCTKHVRDPKLFMKAGRYHLILGARLKNDTSCVLEYVSDDLESWTYFSRYVPVKDMGFMIECPDYLQFQEDAFLLCSPQGLAKRDDNKQNVYDTGYYKVRQQDLIDYEALDYGFDFYAPQTFYNEERNIMIAWIGMPDNAYVDRFDIWNQTLTMPRSLSFDKRILQKPIQEILDLRTDKQIHTHDFVIRKSCNIECDVNSDFSLQLNAIAMTYKQHTFTLDLSACNCQRQQRCIHGIDLHHISIFVDESVLEIFINEGAYTMTARFYDDEQALHVASREIKHYVTYNMRGFQIL